LLLLWVVFLSRWHLTLLASFSNRIIGLHTLLSFGSGQSLRISSSKILGSSISSTTFYWLKWVKGPMKSSVRSFQSINIKKHVHWESYLETTCYTVQLRNVGKDLRRLFTKECIRMSNMHISHVSVSVIKN
jgi:hypothetical protein